MATIEIDDEDNDELKAALEALKDPSRPLTDAQWRALGPMMTLEASDNETRRLQQEARKTLADITKREDTAFTEKLRRINQDTVDRDTKARKFAAEQKLSDDFNARQSEAYAPKRPFKEPPRRPLTAQLQAMEALRPSGPSYDVPRPAPDDLTGFDIEGMRRAMGGSSNAQGRPKSTQEGAQASGPELGPELPEPPLDAFYQTPTEAPENRQSARKEGRAHRLAEGSRVADPEGFLRAAAETDTEDTKKEKRAQVRRDYIERFGRPPTSFRETPEGEILPVLNERDYESTVNWLKLDRLASEAGRHRQLASGEDKVGERQLRIQDDAQASREAMQRVRLESQATEAQRKESVKQEETLRKEEAAYDSDSADALSFASSADATPEEKAFADYMQSTKEGAPGAGLPEQGLKAAIAGARKLRNRVSGLGPSDMMGGRSFSDSARRNVSRFLSDAEAKIAGSFKQVSGQGQALQSAQQPGMTPEAPEQLPLAPEFQNLGPELTRDMGARMAGDIPGFAGTGGVPVGGLTQLGMGVNSLMNFQVPNSPTLQPGQSRLLPKNQAAASQLQQALANKGPVQRATSSLMFGLGTDAQRNKLMDYLVTYGGFDPNQFALRTSLQSDPQWNDIVSQQVIEGIRRTRMGQGPAK